jgi:hypothetical protein
MIDLQTLPDQHGHFGPYGGMFVPETLMTALNELTAEYLKAKADPAFQAELAAMLKQTLQPQERGDTVDPSTVASPVAAQARESRVQLIRTQKPRGCVPWPNTRSPPVCQLRAED